ncbi:serine/threonine-protein kinase [Nonomuraea longicatena]|uniref:serine/threonine-protein kinase n=1 Tax=Nonomuraea longicatena TaxID=83682 RepID=UPI0031D88D42
MTSERVVVDGRFELLERLGSGGMGTVWRAYDLALHREVALKEVRPSHSPDPDRAAMLRERVLVEARALARLHHPNVVTVHHIVDDARGEHPWIVMELVRGPSLHGRLADGPLSPAEAAGIGRGVLAALAAAHAAGICHRDVKPANVLLRDDGRPVLTDFGIAALFDTAGLTATGELVGSPEYIAPERLRGHEGDPASDLWSLGMMLYVAVEGTHPMRRDTPLATLAAVLDGRVPPPVRAGPLTPVLGALLVSDPSARPPIPHLDAMLAQAAVSQSPSPSGAGPQHGRPHAGHRPGPHSGPQPGSLAGPGRHPGPQIGSHAGRHPGPPSGPGAPGGPQGPLPGAQGYGGPPYQTGPVGRASTTDPGSSARRRSGRGRVAGGAIAVTVALGAAGGVLLTLRPWEGRAQVDTPRASILRTMPKLVTPSQPEDLSSRQQKTDPPAKVDLLTPEGARQSIAALQKAAKTKKFVQLVIYGEYAIAEVRLRDDPKAYDRFTYRDGVVTKTIGGPVIGKGADSDPTRFNWDALPRLLADARKTLKVRKPTSYYVIAESASMFNFNQPLMRVYISNAYSGGGYLSADRSGRILKRYPS